MHFLKKHLAGDHGANMVEYTLIVALVALMGFAAVTHLGDSTSDSFTTAAEAMDAGDALGLDGGHSVDSGSQADSDDNHDSGDANQNQDQQGQDQQGQDQQGQDQQGQDQDDQAQDDQAQDDQAQDDQDDQGQELEDEQDDTGTDTGDQDEQDDTGFAGGDQGGQADGGAAGVDGTTEEDEPANTGPAPSGSSSELYWWDSHNTKGQWKASVSFSNETNRHQYLTLEVTTIDEKGKAKTTTVKDFYVGAGSSSTFTHWSNDIDKNGQKVTGVVEVQVRVISVRTSDQNWKTYSYDVNGIPASVTVPALP
jgi:Flp pilus assembly pilin Flp